MAFNIGIQSQEISPPVVAQSDKRQEEIKRIEAQADRDAQTAKIAEAKKIEEEADRDMQTPVPLGGEIGEVLPRPREVSTLPPEEAFKGAPYLKSSRTVRYVSQEEYDRIMAERESQAIKDEADRDMIAGLDPATPRISPVGRVRPRRYEELPSYLPEPTVQPTGVSETGVGEALRSQYGLLPREPAPIELPKPKYWKDKPAWSKDPKINEIGNQVGDLAANAVIYGQLFPNFFVLYESVSELQNMIASKVQEEGYSPLKRQAVSENIKDPELKALVGFGEEGLKLVISGMALNKIPQVMNSIHAEKMGSLAKKLGADPVAVETQVNRWKKAGSGMSIQGEWERLKNFGKGKKSLEESIAKQKAMPVKVAEPIPKPAEAKVPETEIRISKDIATGDTVIKIPRQGIGGEIPIEPTVKPATTISGYKPKGDKLQHVSESRFKTPLKEVEVEVGKPVPRVGEIPKEFSREARDFISEDYLDWQEGDVNELFHVTTAKDSVLREGLKPGRETGKVGLGEGVQTLKRTPDLVSTTFSENAAYSIEQRLKLAVKAARGKSSVQDILAEFNVEYFIDDMPMYDPVWEVLRPPKEVGKSWDLFDKWVEKEYKGKEYDLLAELDDGLAQVYEEPMGRVGLTADAKDVAKIDPEQISVLEVGARRGAKPVHIPDESELRFSPGDLWVKHAPQKPVAKALAEKPTEKPWEMSYPEQVKYYKNKYPGESFTKKEIRAEVSRDKGEHDLHYSMGGSPEQLRSREYLEGRLEELNKRKAELESRKPKQPTEKPETIPETKEPKLFDRTETYIKTLQEGVEPVATEKQLIDTVKEAKKFDKIPEKPTPKPEDNLLVKETPLPDIPEPQRLAFKQKTEKLERMQKELLDGTASHSPRSLRKGYNEIGRPLSPEQEYLNEEKYADRVFSKGTGETEKIFKTLKSAGVRDEIIQSIKNARIVEGHILESIKHFRREPKTGAISGVMTKKMENWLRQTYKGSPEGGGGGSGKIKEYTEGFFDDSDFAKLTRPFMVPQVAFKHMGLGSLYDMLRGGERGYQNLRSNIYKESDAVYKKLGITKKDREMITKLNMTRQGKWVDMRIGGLDGVELSDLSPAAKARWRWEQKIFQKYSPQIEKQAKLVNVVLGKIENYAPLYTKKGIKAAKKVEVPGGEKDSPWFKSISERVENVPIEQYELDSKKTFENFVDGMARFTEFGGKSIPLKYIIDSPEFAKIVGEKDLDFVKKWFEYSVSPPPTPKGWRWLRRAGYSAYLGLNPISMSKQFISWSDAMLLEKIGGPSTKAFKSAIKKMEIPSVGERDVEATVADLKNKYDRIMLWGIRTADKFLAGDAMTKMLAGRLQAKKNAGKELDSKSLRTVLREAQNDLDLLMMGSTPAQRPEIFRQEWGKLFLQFQSTITSRVNSYLERASGSTNNKDLLAIARVIGAFMVGGYLESVMTDMRVKKLWDKEDFVEILKSAGGNIPLAGTAIWALDRGEWTPAPFVQTINDALAALKKMSENFGLKEIGDTALTLGQIVGLPKQVKKTIEGISVTEGKGKRVSRSKYIEVDKLDEKIRAWVKGQYGPKEVKEYFKDKDLKSRLNKRVAEIFASTKNKALLKKLPEMTRKPFWGDNGEVFMRHAKTLGFEDYRKIFNIRKRAKKEEIELNPTTILNYIREMLKD